MKGLWLEEENFDVSPDMAGGSYHQVVTHVTYRQSGLIRGWRFTTKEGIGDVGIR